MNKDFTYSIIETAMRRIEGALEILRRYPSSYGLDHKIVYFRRLQRSEHVLADFSVTMACRKGLRTFLFCVKLGPSRPLTKHFKKLLDDSGITALCLNMHAKFKAIERELARLLKNHLYGPVKQVDKSLYPRSRLHNRLGYKMPCAA